MEKHTMSIDTGVIQVKETMSLLAPNHWEQDSSDCAIISCKVHQLCNEIVWQNVLWTEIVIGRNWYGPKCPIINECAHDLMVVSSIPG